MSTERRYDTATGRWHVFDTARTPVTPFSEESPGVWVSRDDSGAIAECLVADDAVANVPGEVGRMLADGLGVDMADLVSPPSARQLATVGSATEIEPLPATRTIREPGIPYMGHGGSVLVPTPSGEIRVSSSDSVLMIDVPMRSSHEWVRVSDAATGDLLALGRVHAGREGLGANVTFALDEGDIHITLTDTPLDPVADRRSRRLEWIDAVLGEVRAHWWRRPIRSRSAAREAASVARALGDERRASLASRYARLLPGYMAATSLCALAVGVLGAGAIRTDAGPRLAVQGASTATYTFGTAGSVTLSVDINDDGSTLLVVRDSVPGSHDFGRDPSTPGAPADEQAWRRNCAEARDVWVAGKNVRAVTATYAVSLRSQGSDPVLLGTVTMSSETETMSTVPGACDAAVLGSDGTLLADVLYSRATEQFTLPAPSGIRAAGVWTLAVDRVTGGTDPSTGVSAQPVTFRTDG